MKFLVSIFLAAFLAFPLPAGAQTRDTWRSVRTNNLFVIGNADSEKLRQVAVWLEFFHSAFGRLVSRNVLDSSSPTTVIVFRDDASFIPFKPLYEGRPANLAGFFQPGDDMNYIAMSLDPRLKDPYEVAFHEYVHLHLRDNVPGVPLWLNEGLAEFYGALQFSGGEAVLGAPLPYVRLLRSEELLPLKELFSIDSRSPHYNEQDKSGIFYGESWALVHYLMLGGGAARQEQFKRFLHYVGRGDNVVKAIEDSFGMTADTLEKELHAYVRRGEMPTLRIASGDDPQAYASYTAMQRVSLTEAEASYYLGDLLLHIGRDDDAERYFKQAINLDPGLTIAYAALGQLTVGKKRYAEAKKYLQRATTSQQHYLVHYYYAWVLGRDAVSPTGQITEYAPETAATMREQLLRTIKLAPNFAPAYYLLAMVNVVTDQRLDEAQAMAEKARQLQPSKAAYALLLGEIYARRSDATAARTLLEPLTRNSDPAIRNEAQNWLDSLNNASARNRAPVSPRNTTRASGALVDEPVKTSTVRILGGDAGGNTAIRDGQTIQNSGSMPTVDQLLARYVEAMGGAKAINALTSRDMKGTVDVAGVSRGGSFVTYMQVPNKTYGVIQAHPFGTITFGFNGRAAWVQSVKGGVQPVKTPGELAIIERDADLHAPLHLKNNYAKISSPGMSQIGYRDVYVLDLQPATGAVERLYLDAKTFLPVRLNTVRKNGTTLEPVEIYYDDWRAVDGVQYPFSMSQRFAKLTLSFTVTEIRHNVPIEARLFEPPVK
jgi:tetratricopeptide (TPR) repeat protein